MRAVSTQSNQCLLDKFWWSSIFSTVQLSQMRKTTVIHSAFWLYTARLKATALKHCVLWKDALSFHQILLYLYLSKALSQLWKLANMTSFLRTVGMTENPILWAELRTSAYMKEMRLLFFLFPTKGNMICNIFLNLLISYLKQKMSENIVIPYLIRCSMTKDWS